MNRDPNSQFYPAPRADGGPPRLPPGQRVPGRGHTVASLVFASMALLIPILAGAVGIAFAFGGRSRGDPLFRWAIWLNGVATVAGLFIVFVAVPHLETATLLP